MRLHMLENEYQNKLKGEYRKGLGLTYVLGAFCSSKHSEQSTLPFSEYITIEEVSLVFLQLLHLRPDILSVLSVGFLDLTNSGLFKNFWKGFILKRFYSQTKERTKTKNSNLFWRSFFFDVCLRSEQMFIFLMRGFRFWCVISSLCSSY